MHGKLCIDHQALAEAAFRKSLPGLCVEMRCVLEAEPSDGHSYFFHIEASCTDGSIFWGGAEVSANGSRIDVRVIMTKKPGETVALLYGEEYKNRF